MRYKMGDHPKNCPWHYDYSRCECHVFRIHNLEYEITYYIELLKTARDTFSIEKNYKMIDKIDDTLKKFNR